MYQKTIQNKNNSRKPAFFFGVRGFSFEELSDQTIAAQFSPKKKPVVSSGEQQHLDPDVGRLQMDVFVVKDQYT